MVEPGTTIIMSKIYRIIKREEEELEQKEKLACKLITCTDITSENVNSVGSVMLLINDNISVPAALQ